MFYQLDGLDRLPNLDTLNVCNNRLTSLPYMGCCPNLHTLICSDNELASLEALQNLVDNKELTTLDLQNNKIEDTQVTVQFQTVVHSSLKQPGRYAFNNMQPCAAPCIGA